MSWDKGMVCTLVLVTLFSLLLMYGGKYTPLVGMGWPGLGWDGGCNILYEYSYYYNVIT